MRYNKLITSFLEAIKKNESNEEIKNFNINKSKIHGNGAFAAKRIAPGQFINVALFKGKDGEPRTTHFGAHLNHCSKPNARTRFEGDHYRTYCEKEINPGDEITVDYRKNKSLEQPGEDWKDTP